MRRIRALGSSPTCVAQLLDELGRRMDRHEVGLREVAVVLRLLLASGAAASPRCPGRSGASPARPCRPTRRSSICRAISFSIPLAAKLNEFMFFSSVRVRSSSEPAGRTETLTSKRIEPFSSSASREPELDHRLAQQLQEALGVVGRVDVGLGDDLEQRRAAAVEVDERRGRAVDAARRRDVDVLRRVLLEVRADDPDLDVAVGRRHGETPARAERLVVLGDLVRLRVVGIEVVLAVEDGPRRRSCSRARGRA